MGNLRNIKPMGNPQIGPDPVQQAKFNQMVKDADFISCPECGGKTFSEKLMFKKISGIMTGSGQDQLINIPVLACDKCGKVPKIFDPNNVVPPDMLAEQPGNGLTK